ncbi:hypothetical protein NRK68_08935 [Streptomyces yangpuensis]|uniref:Uncharacterized protein n=1 Tax=Streptomyces yangpuensis TaxID=1648182 RepID=A0ABY5PT89_9ACTN|nr:hypothetical protein [Streptomyces yangpuensis]UUY47331.1 hypothetical protein NRK68_08935 [Streptomyces yangpuensis]
MTTPREAAGRHRDAAYAATIDVLRRIVANLGGDGELPQPKKGLATGPTPE